MHAVVIFSRFGPYHVARLEAAGKHFALNKGRITGIEITRTGTVYAWAPVEGGAHFNKVTLFEHCAYEAVTRKQIASTLCATLDNLAPDGVAIPGWSSVEALAALRWTGRHNVPAILMSESTRTDAPRHAIGEAVKRRLVRRFGAALVGGQRHVDYLAALGMPRRRVALGYDTVDNLHFINGSDAARHEAQSRRAALGLPRRYFLASCRFIPKKNLSRVLQAYAIYRHLQRDDAWDLVICGDGVLRPDLENQASALGLAASTHFHGFRDYGELPAYYGLAGAFIQASTVEQWGLVVNEAAASALPLLVSEPTGSITELLREGENGFTFDPRDVPALAEHMKRLAHGGCDLGAMGARSREIVSQWNASRFGTGLAEAARIAGRHPAGPLSVVDRCLIPVLMNR